MDETRGGGGGEKHPGMVRLGTSVLPIHVHQPLKLLYTPYISRGFYFREFRESGASREFNNMRKYLPPIWTHECDLCTPPRSRI